MRLIIVSISILALLSTIQSSGIYPETSSMEIITNAEPPDVTFELTSDYTEKTYKIEIHLPYDYNENRTKSYPVLYFPNSLYHNPTSGNVHNQYNNLNEFTNFTELFELDILPRVLIIGITDIQFSQSRYEQDVIRQTADFSNFFEHELIPKIEAEYNADPSERIIAGWLDSAFFVMDSFFKYPNSPFSKFISINGYLYPASRTTDGQPDLLLAEAEMANRLGNGADIDADLFLTAKINDADSYSSFKEINRALFRRNYNLLNLRTEIINYENDWGYGWFTGLGIWQNYNNYIYAAYQIENEDIYVGEEVLFNFAGSEGNHTQVTYFWDFDDGTNSSTRSPSYIFTLAGVYRVNLTITDEFNFTSSYVIPGSVRILPGFRPIEVGETSVNMQNTESYKTKENNIDDVEFQKPWLLILPIFAIIRKRRHKKDIY